MVEEVSAQLLFLMSPRFSCSLLETWIFFYELLVPDDSSSSTTTTHHPPTHPSTHHQAPSCSRVTDSLRLPRFVGPGRWPR